MSLFLLVPFFAFVLNIVLIASAVTRGRRSSVNYVYIVLLGFIASWELIDVISFLPGVGIGVVESLAQYSTIILISGVFLYLHFIYLSTGVKRDIPFYLMGGVAVIMVLFDLYVPQVITGVNIVNGIVLYEHGAMYFPAVVACFIVPVSYSMYLTAKAKGKAKAFIRREQFQCIFVGILISFTLGIILGPLQRACFETPLVPCFSSSISAIQSLFLFIAVLKYDFLSADLKSSAYEILSHVADAVIIVNAENEVLKMNEPATELFSGFLADRAQCSLEDLELPGISISKQENNKEVAIRCEGKVVKKRTVLLSLTPLYHSGTNSGAVITLRDITDRINLEQQLRHTQKMESVGQLAGGIAHDFNNMLGGIMGGTELLSLKLRDRPELEQILNVISDSTRRATDLTQKLLSFSRKGKFLSRPIDLHDTIGDALDLLSCSIDRKIKVDTEFKATDSVISGDKSQLQNAILNLGLNARDAMPLGGKVIIKTLNMNLKQSINLSHGGSISKGEYITITISDTGRGMDADVMDRIFEPFFTTKEVGKGTGLGLSAVYASINDHNGLINVSSSVGSGTNFTIYLPVYKGSEKYQRTQKFNRLHRGSGTILLADDESIIRFSGKQMLEAFGYSVILAEDGVDALDKYRADPDKVDLVILDMVMPKAGGEETFRRIKEIDPGAKIIISSGFPRDSAIDSMLQNGVSGFIKKPYGIGELSQLTSEIMGSCKMDARIPRIVLKGY